MKILLLVLMLTTTMLAQSTFNYRYSLGFDASGFSSVVPVDSGYYITGLGAKNTQYQGNTQAVIAFADTLGQIVWYKQYIGEAGRNLGAFEGNLQLKNDSSFVTVGAEFGSGWIKSCMFNYDSNGDTIWIKKFFSPIDTGGYTKAEALMFTNDGGFLMGSSIQPSFDLDTRILLTKVDSAGNEEWYRIYGSSSLYYREEWPVLKNIDGQIVMAARRWKWIWATTSNYDMQHQFWWLDSVGNVMQTYTTPTIKPGTLNTPWQMRPPWDFLQTKDKGWVVATAIGTEIQTAPPNAILFDPYIYKLDSNFNFVWDKKIQGFTYAYITEIDRIFEKEDSSLIAFGTLAVDSFYKGIMVKLSPQGDSLWSRHFYIINGLGDENNISDVRPTPDGGYIICGQALVIFNSGGQPAQQGWLLKLDSMGCLVPGCHLTAVAQTEGAAAVPIKVFPNPATDFINVYVPAILGFVDTHGRAYLPNQPKIQPPFHLHLYDLNGRLLQNHPIPQSDATYMLTTEGLETGMYILQLLDDGGQVLGMEKVMVK